MNIKMYLAFVKWCFMKMFGSTFDKLESFRYNLKRGTPDSIFAMCGFVLISIMVILASLLATAFFTESTEVVKQVGAVVFWVAVATFFYNIFKAAFECFLEERERVFDELKR